MKHSTIGTVIALAWAFAAPAQAQQPPAQPPAPKPAEPAAPPAAPAPAAPAPAAAPAPPAPAPEPAPPPAAAPAPEPPPAAAAPAAPPEAAPAPAPAAQPSDAPEAHPIKETDTFVKFKPFLGLGIGTPDTGTLPGRFRPAYGAPRRTPSDYKFDFHGYLSVPLRFGINERQAPLKTQYKTVLHGPPLVPDDFERFEHTGVVPQPWVQLGFSYGNSNAVANIIIAARTVTDAQAFFDPPTQLGINNAFVTFTPKFSGADVQVDVGAFANRYGAMGDYDLGRYDTPIIGRVGGVGETLRISVPMTSTLRLLAEHGVMGQLDKAPLGVEPAGWNSFADPNVGTSFAHHAHLGLALQKMGQLGLHYITAWAQDDRTAPLTPDGTITVFGADASAELTPFGRVYVAGAYTDAESAQSVSGVIRVLNTFGGPGLMREYLGDDPASDGTGSLTTIGGQYDLSIGQVLRGAERFSGYGPDVFVSLFGMFTSVSSEQADHDGIDKVKYGAEVSYSMLSWLGVSGRYDRVIANTDDDTQTFAVISPRIILRTDYNSQDQVTLQYSRWFYGSGVAVRTGYPPRPDPSRVPDEDTFSLTANVWW